MYSVQKVIYTQNEVGGYGRTDPHFPPQTNMKQVFRLYATRKTNTEPVYTWT